MLVAGYGLGLVATLFAIASMSLLARHSSWQPHQSVLAMLTALLPAITLAGVYTKRDEFHLGARSPSIAIAQFENKSVRRINILAETAINNVQIIAYGQIALTGAISPGWQATVVWRDGSQQIATPRDGLFAVVRTKASVDLSLQPPAADWTRLESARVYLTDGMGRTTLLQPKWFLGKPEPGTPKHLLP
jgi:hypothetical protein